MKSICFTGHRNVKLTPELERRLYVTLERLIRQGAVDFYAGGALGWDTFCAEAVLSLRKSNPQIRLHLVLPCPPEEQTAKWTEYQKNEYSHILSDADSAEILSEQYHSDCMKKRNARLVEYADCCVCYYNRRSASGTGQTVRMAQKRGIVIYNLAEQEDAV